MAQKPGPNTVDTQEKIVRAICDSEKGRLTQSDIAEEADIARKTVYNNIDAVLENYPRIKTEEVAGHTTYYVEPRTDGNPLAAPGAAVRRKARDTQELLTSDEVSGAVMITWVLFIIALGTPIIGYVMGVRGALFGVTLILPALAGLFLFSAFLMRSLVEYREALE